jgi:type 2A phosphatase activator TIP41
VCRLDDDVKELEITYDWTYTTDYKGTVGRIVQGNPSIEDTVRVEATNERIDFEKLKVQELILWMEEINLYEDELHDHGISIMSIRVVRQ